MARQFVHSQARYSIPQLAGKRWKVDLASRHEASLLLSAVNLPGGIQRRRNAEDELRMREVFKEGDLLSVSVCLLMCVRFKVEDEL